MSNLVPIKMLDKNNRVVTRHVRADGSTARRRRIPSPSAGRVDDAPSGSELYMRNDTHLSMKAGKMLDMLPANYRRQLATSPSQIISSVGQILTSNAMGLRLSEAVLETNEFLEQISKDSDANNLTWFTYLHEMHERFTNDLALAESKSPHLTKSEAAKLKAYFLAHLILKNSSDVAHESPRVTESDETYVRKNFKALEPAIPLILQCASTVKGPGHIATAMDKVNFAAKYPGRLDEIVAIVKERGEYDEQLIASILDGPSSALSDGTL